MCKKKMERKKEKSFFFLIYLNQERDQVHIAPVQMGAPDGS